MQCFLILGFALRNTETVLEMVDWFFYIYMDLIGFFPFLWTTFYTRIGTKVLLWINVNHSAAGRTGAWILIMTLAERFSSILVVRPFHFGTYKFHGRKFAPQMRFTPFPFHWKWWIMRTAGNAVFIDRIVNTFHRKLCFQRNKSFFENRFLQRGICRF